ncbi:aldehyde dehydrogenase family protein [Desulforhopalus sp. 52FAK]
MVAGLPGKNKNMVKNMTVLQEVIPNYINGKMIEASSGQLFGNIDPHSGKELCKVARSGAEDALVAVAAAKRSQVAWANMTSVARGDVIRDIAFRMIERKNEIAEIVATESGKALPHALGETQAAIEMGLFIAGEGRRNYGKTMGATMANRQVLTVRQPLGVAALIIASNTPMANVAWKAFPSMFCGNSSIMKPSEDTPGTAWIFADICREVGLPDGVFNVIQGLGAEAGMPLVESGDVDLVSFTGGHVTGSLINRVAGARLAKVCLELGGKNALTVCDDADMDNAVQWALASAFSNAGQRCVAASRLIVFDSVYEQFKEQLVSATAQLSLGVGEEDYLGPVINEHQLNGMLVAIENAKEEGAEVLVGGNRASSGPQKNGYYMQPTVIENVSPDAQISQNELFGPITCLYRVKDLHEAIELVNNSQFGLSSSIHTNDINRAMEYSDKVNAGVIVVNGGTHGSEPHMGFGGLKNSGTGWREAGVEALDVYSDVKYINLITNPSKV